MDKNGYKDLRIYAESIKLVSIAFKLCNENSLNKEYSITSQLKRAVISIPLNIAEGYGRKTTNDFKQFLSISLGSCNEVIALLDCVEVITNLNIKVTRDRYSALSKQIYSFRKSLAGGKVLP